ncbi:MULTISPECIES: response regulator transcription factor [unclassified Streptomyces]|uniref:response regulator transcription factor n=1 Tax=unclassified Streptomyces TaxID=2593676 RepID=UPI002DDBA9F7|nr:MULTISPECIES: response regulator transcription factor [unclassified Streptomyces]WSA90888.1 response regulator transcription factor [Streptomyces sp. NBC_01795]WSB75211.1 response regulator transcription factor [Streptomyces sp. NBC_01775]WSS16505.1 response regulator transcription factor [Streptomyces sp. NBC_01186]WSS45322.1 response regulator transcription factor [Streptomyces sp. NBC_01187]
MIRVLLVHDVRIIRCALAALVGKEPDMAIESAPWREAVRMTRALTADVCVVDADVTGRSPLDELAGLSRAPGAKRGAQRLLVLVSQNCPGALRRALDAGVQGFVCKDALPEQLVTGIRRVAKGERFVDNALAGTLLRASEVPLSRRELTVLSAAAEGASVPEIARRLGLSTGTVRNYMSAITRKTGARNRVDAIRISQGAGWL